MRARVNAATGPARSMPTRIAQVPSAGHIDPAPGSGRDRPRPGDADRLPSGRTGRRGHRARARWAGRRAGGLGIPAGRALLPWPGKVTSAVMPAARRAFFETRLHLEPVDGHGDLAIGGGGQPARRRRPERAEHKAAGDRRDAAAAAAIRVAGWRHTGRRGGGALAVTGRSPVTTSGASINPRSSRNRASSKVSAASSRGVVVVAVTSRRAVRAGVVGASLRRARCSRTRAVTALMSSSTAATSANVSPSKAMSSDDGALGVRETGHRDIQLARRALGVQSFLDPGEGVGIEQGRVRSPARPGAGRVSPPAGGR